MTYLILGILVWSLVHFLPSAMAGFKAKLVGKTGDLAYKAGFGVLIIISVLLMIKGWKALPGEQLFEPFGWADELCLLLMLVTSVLFFAPYMQTNVSRYLRHPQLTGVLLWGVGHILASGQLRSLVLFGGLGAWALIEIFLINQREGAWSKPGAASFKSEVKLLVAGMGFFLLFMFTHNGLFGVTAVPH